MVKFPRGDWKTDVAVWSPITVEGRRSAIIACPLCAKPFTLTNHTIEADGIVKPSVVCPREVPRPGTPIEDLPAAAVSERVECPHPLCGFHAMVTLESWGS